MLRAELTPTLRIHFKIIIEIFIGFTAEKLIVYFNCDLQFSVWIMLKLVLFFTVWSAFSIFGVSPRNCVIMTEIMVNFEDSSQFLARNQLHLSQSRIDCYFLHTASSLDGSNTFWKVLLVYWGDMLCKCCCSTCCHMLSLLLQTRQWRQTMQSCPLFYRYNRP